MGWDKKRFENSEPDEFFKALIGFNELEQERRREQWEQTRLISYYSIAANAPKGTKPKDLFRLPWDEEEKRKTKEQFLKENEHLKPIWDKLKEK